MGADGKHYDYVFPVELDGMNLKIAWNVTDNPYGVAERFLIDNNLDAGYSEQIVQFIFKNTPDVGRAPGGSNPFTNAASGPMANCGAPQTGLVANPFGQAIGTVANALGTTPALGSVGANPFGTAGPSGPLAQTGLGGAQFSGGGGGGAAADAWGGGGGGGGDVYGAAAAVGSAQNIHFPKTDFYTFRSEAKIFGKMKSKLESLAAEIDADEASMSDGPALRDQDTASLGHLFEILADVTHYHRHCTVTAPSLHHHCTITVPSL